MNKSLRWLVLVFLISCTTVLLGKSEYYRNSVTGKDPNRLGAIPEWAWKGTFHPFLEANLGKSILKDGRFKGELPKNGLFELKLGYSQFHKYENIIWEMDDRFVFGTYMSGDLLNSENSGSGNLSAKVRRFGFGNRLGYGYKLGPIVVLPYSQHGLIWTEIKTIRSDNLNSFDGSILDRYEDAYRFGMNTEGGIKIQFFNFLAVSGSYELAVIYPRHIFWPWLGSYMIMHAGVGLVSVFADDILHSSNIFSPIFYFVLKNGIAYAFYQGVKENMNWPFKSEVPMTMEAYRLGVTFTF
jgi:hypothetical protein